jgi:single-strand DNA-binding protein
MSVQNNVTLIGRLVKDPEMRFTAGTGIAVSTFTLAVDRNYAGQDGQKQADFIPVVCWRKLAEIVANNLSKGKLIAVSGSIQTRKYQAQDGSNRYATEVVADDVRFLESTKKNGSTDNGNQNGYESTGFEPVDDPNSDIPF